MSKPIRRFFKLKYSPFFLFNAEVHQKRTLSLTLGFYLGIFPVFGITTLLVFFSTVIFRLNFVFSQGMNLLVTPLQLVLIYPFLKAGRLIFFSQKQVLPDVSLQFFFSVENWDSFLYLIESVIGGIIVWALVALITFPFVFRLFDILQFKGKIPNQKTSV